MSSDHRALFARIADVMNRSDWDALGTVFTEDVVQEYPQSGEVIRGLDNAIAMQRNYPGGLVEGRIDTASARLPGSDRRWAVTSNFTIVKADGSGDTATVIFRTRYPDGSIWWLTAVYELRDDMVARATLFFAPEFKAPDWRAPYREPLPPKSDR